MGVFFSLFLTAQNTKEYYLEIKQGHELGTIQKIVNSDQSLTLNFTNQAFANILNNSSIYTFERMYPSVQDPRLQRIYFMEVSENFTNETRLFPRAKSSLPTYSTTITLLGKIRP